MPDTSGNTYGIARADRGYFVLGRSALQASPGTETGKVLALQDGSGVSYPPKFLDVPGTANNVLDVSEYLGLYYPSARVAVDVIADWFTTANLNAWFMSRGVIRGQAGYDDLSVIGNGAIYSDGNRATALLGAKGDMLSLSSRQNDIVRCNMSIMGAARSEVTWEPVAAPLGSRASFAHVRFVSGVAGVIDFQLQIMNNCAPNPIMGDGAGTAVTEINAGKPRFELSLKVDAKGVFPVYGTPIIFTITPPGGTVVTFTATLPRINDPDNLRKQGVRANQDFNVIAKSVDGVTNGLIIS